MRPRSPNLEREGGRSPPDLFNKDSVPERSKSECSFELLADCFSILFSLSLQLRLFFRLASPFLSFSNISSATSSTFLSSFPSTGSSA